MNPNSQPSHSSGISAYITHLRPRSWPTILLHFAAGFVLSKDLSEFVTNATTLLYGAFIWTVLLNGGTLALNSSFDNDTGDIGFLDSPPPPPRGLGIFSFILLTLGLPLSYLHTDLFFYTYLACYVMSLLYSVPPIRMKARPGFDILINCLGYGSLTFFAGYAIHTTGTPSTEAVLIACGFFFLFAAFYPLTQIYQLDQDMADNVVTFTVWLGKKPVLWFALICAVIAHVLFFFGAMGNTTGQLVMTISLLVWTALLLGWISSRSYNEKMGMYRAIGAWGLTDLFILFIF